MNYVPSEDITTIFPSDIKLFDLAKTFKNILDNLPENNELDIISEEISLQEQMNFIMDILSNKKKIYLTEIIAGNSKIYVINSFLAILELIRIKEINFKQIKNFSDIIISRIN